MSLISQKFQLADDTQNLGLTCSPSGVSLAGVPLLRKTASGFSPRSADEIDALMKAAYGHKAGALKSGLKVIAEALNKGDVGRAMVAALQLRLPALSRAGAYGIALTDETLAKFDPDQPRDERGRWTDDGGSAGASGHGGASSSQSLKPIPVFYPGKSGGGDEPHIPPDIMCMMMSRQCIKHAQDPDYQSKVEDCASLMYKCTGLVKNSIKNPRADYLITWPDGGALIIRFGFTIPVNDGHPF